MVSFIFNGVAPPLPNFPSRINPVSDYQFLPGLCYGPRRDRLGTIFFFLTFPESSLCGRRGSPLSPLGATALLDLLSPLLGFPFSVLMVVVKIDCVFPPPLCTLPFQTPHLK